MITAQVQVNGKIFEVRRLDAAGELEARQNAVWDHLGTDVPDEEFDEAMASVRVFYRDDLDRGTSEYTVDNDAGTYNFGWHLV